MHLGPRLTTPDLAAIRFAGMFLSCANLVSAEPYVPVNPHGALFGNSVMEPRFVPGKQYSLDLDVDASGAIDPRQVVAWDGLGGTQEGPDFSNSRPSYAADAQ